MPETLMNALIELEEAYNNIKNDPNLLLRFAICKSNIRVDQLRYIMRSDLTEQLGGAKIYLKREDLNHTGAHKINNTIGQGGSRETNGEKKIIAETGAGQHGVASATVAA